MIFILCMDPLGSDDDKVLFGHLLWSDPHLSFQVEKQPKGRENDVAKVSPKSEGVSSLCIQAKPLALSLGLACLPTVFQSCIYQVTAQKECIFSFSWGGGSAGPKPQII